MAPASRRTLQECGHTPQPRCAKHSNALSSPYAMFCRPQIAFKGSHLVFIEGRGIRSAPHVPHIVLCKVLLLRTVLVKVRGTESTGPFLQQLMSPIFFLADAHMLETSVFVQGYGSVVQQVTVAHQIHAAIRKQANACVSSASRYS